MKLLITGAARFTDEQLNKLSSLGFELVFQRDERGEPETDFKSVDAAILNGLFLYHGVEEFENLKFVQLTSAGLDRVPLDDLRARSIKLCNARGVYSVPIAEFAVTGVLDLYKKSYAFYLSKKTHVWDKQRDIKELNGSTVAVIGCGSVGTECARRFKAFGTRIIGVDIFKPTDSAYDVFYLIEDVKKAVSVSDIVVLALPLTDKTKGSFDRELFASFKDGSVLVNIARGAIVNEADLTNALKSGKLFGAVLDVFEKEPLGSESELWELDNVIITPHNSFVSDKNTGRLFEVCYDNLREFVKEEAE